MRKFFILVMLLILGSDYGYCQVWKIDTTVISSSEKIIFGNKYLFQELKAGGTGQLLRISLLIGSDTVKMLERDLIHHTGDEFARVAIAAEYKLDGDHLIFYTYRKFTDGVSPPNISYTTLKETFVIQKKGAIVRLTIEYGKSDPILDREIKNRLQKKLDEASKKSY